MAKKKKVPPPGFKYEFRAWITTKSGKVIYASWFGYKAFPLLVPINK
jgi:hypothetical protein